MDSAGLGLKMTTTDCCRVIVDADGGRLVTCNTLGVKHALSLINPFISILIKHSIT